MLVTWAWDGREVLSCIWSPPSTLPGTPPCPTHILVFSVAFQFLPLEKESLPPLSQNKTTPSPTPILSPLPPEPDLTKPGQATLNSVPM